ncbi:cytochrome P450 [Palleronia abyssalis]|uniref:Biotin biosynthesis cytochrome P450 n=1 Tax=Palleronia abyssalis TaxID=1501240 RepID=A0A2R8BVD9_9RHOB|nr:cytochrome P450 [Palleronia abyssalis]SPJ24056.1 Biotin biosynthesis cytochrome P450 [Palleronia abyssalis]
MDRISQSPVDPAFVADPYPFYARLRAVGNIAVWDDYDMPVAASHRAVTALLRDRRLGRETPEERREPVPDHVAPFYAVEDHSMLELDGPRHARLRRQVLTAFTSKRVAGLAPAIEALCHDLLDATNGPFDLIDAYAAPLPVRTIARLIGLPEDMAPQLLDWSHAMVGMYQAGRTRAMEDAAADAAGAFRAHLAETMAARRAEPRDDLLSAMVTADNLSDPERIATAILLLNAGHEATVHALGNAVIHLCATGTRPTEGLVDELLRLDPPLHLFTRWVLEDAELFGHQFRRGDRIGLLLGAANRDPEAYPDPDRLIPDRAGPSHTAFGGGAHFCLGAPLARLELEISLRVLFQRMPGLHLVEPAEIAPIYHFRGPARLRVAP